jgi:transposase
MESITLNERQQRRLDVILIVQSGKTDKSGAAELLGVSRRQIDNILRRFEENRLVSLVHGNTGKKPANKTPEATVEQLLALAGEEGKYHDFNVSHLHDVLTEDGGPQVGRSTLDRLLKKHGVRQPKRSKPKEHRRRREPSPSEGMMIQIDASPHAWLGEAQPRLALMGAIDDATGKILHLELRPTEDQAGYLRLFRHIAVEYGLPMSYYHDRHTMLHSPKTLTVEEELQGKKALSELQRVLESLGVASISAGSPQAKGRVERLWGTLQDRLLKEMRVAGVTTLEAANTFLPRFIQRYNARFARAPQDPQSVWIPMGAERDLDYYFSVQETRVVRNDHTISWHGKTLLILRKRGEVGLQRKKVVVHTTPEGKVCLYEGTQRLNYREIQERPPVEAAAAPVRSIQEAAPIPDPKSRARQCAWLHAGLK